MKYIFSSILLLSAFGLHAQPLRVHLAGGVSNYTGDLQSKRYTFNQARGVISAGATFNLTEKFALRSEYSFGKVSGDDKFGTNNRARNLNFTSYIQEFNLLGEYDILNTYNYRLTPYVFAGVGVFRFSPFTYDNRGNKVHLHGLRTEGQETSQYPDRKQYKRIQVNFPIGGGIKYALSDDIHLGLEVAYRKLFTDYLDDVSATYADENVLRNEVGANAVAFAFRGDELTHNPRPYPAAGTARGSSKYKDSYYFTQLRISFRLNWFDNGGGYGGGKNNRMGCPTRVY